MDFGLDDDFDQGNGTYLTAGYDDFQYKPGYYDNSDEIGYTSPSPAPRYYKNTTAEPYCDVSALYEDDIDEFEERHNHHIGYVPSAQAETSYVSETVSAAQPVSYLSKQFRDPRQSASTRPTQRNFQHPRKTPTGFMAKHPHQYNPNLAADYQFPSQTVSSSSRIPLIPVSRLPDMYKSIFKFGVFNAVQSSCFDTVIHSDENIVISAPTGSGKTVLFELSIIRMLGATRESGKSLKCVYMAPTKALCSERFKDWSFKFTPLGIKCCELTGDTATFGQGAWSEARSATIIITTGEKWDSLTRNWDEHSQILQQIQVFMVDEVHILNESRGSTLEVIVTRMKLRGSHVRFVLVSATVPNIQDIAAWISSHENNMAKVFQFGEEYRPCKLNRIVVGVPRQKNQNDFQFAKTLDFKLFPTLQAHTVGKPILVFCSTRKGVFGTAERLQKDFEEAEKKRQSLPWTRPQTFEYAFTDKRLKELAVYGIGVHHAGLSFDDRRATEDMFLKKQLRIVVATSTLAVGVNLPAHTVVIRGIQTFQNNMSVEYSDLDIVQMLGRAGRPQFDKDGLGIIICETSLEAKYRALAQGQTILESCLHLNLAEHLNSEIGLGTIKDVSTAKDWLKTSFLFQRIQKNPEHYSVKKGETQTWQEKMDDLVVQGLEKLKSAELIEYDDGQDSVLHSTEYGDIMSKFYIRQATMSLILALPDRPTMRDILHTISSAEELTEVKLRASDKTYLNKLRIHNDIRFEVRKVEKTSDKIFLLIQASRAVLGGISLSNPEFKTNDGQPQLEAFNIFKHVSRVAKAIVEVGIVKKRGAQIKHGLEAFVQNHFAKAWEDRPVVLRQLESIGEKSLKVLAEHGITSLDALRKQDSLRLEVLLNRRPPFGLEILAAVREFPIYALKIQEQKVASNGGRGPVRIDLSVECGLEGGDPAAPRTTKKHKQQGSMTVILTVTSDMELVDFRRIPTKALKERKTFHITFSLDKPSQSVSVIISSECLAGVAVVQTYRPNIPSQEYPTLNTRPVSALELDLEEFENDPDFWNVDFDLEDAEPVEIKSIKREVKDLTIAKDHVKLVSSRHSQQPAPPKDEPRKLSNGNYECNHTCKDKHKCRHLCCREGLPNPPKTPSRTADPSGASQSTQAKHSADKSKKSSQCRVLKDLDNLHKKINVEHNLKLSNGQRLKLEPAHKFTKRKRDQSGSFEVQFAELSDPHPPAKDIPITLDDTDELPEPHKLMDRPMALKRKRQSSDNYLIDDAVDKLIRDFVEVEEKEYSPPTKEQQKLDSVLKAASGPGLSSGDSLANKRMKLNTDIDTTKSPLFFSSPISIPSQDDAKEADEFALDPIYFESRPSTPELSVGSTLQSVNSSVIFSPMTTGRQTRATTPCISPVEEKSIPAGDEQHIEEEFEDEFAAFDAWLNSGAVEIVPNNEL